MKTFTIYLLALPLLSLSCGNKAPETTAETAPTIKLIKVVDKLTSPLVTVFPEGTNDMLVAEQHGIIKLFKNGVVAENPFLDLRSKMVKIGTNYEERGLLGMALHPQFKTNHKFYVYYSAPSNASGSDHKSVISEFVSSGTSTNINSERVILTFEQPESNHNGGCLQFGNDGYLYISSGDGGGAGDKHGGIGNGQNLNTLLGKILRIDVSKGNTYTVPADNPFVGKSGRPEIWAYGLRNPWRFSFDSKTNLLFAADVGQNAWEEVDIVEKGGNYGWKIMEGSHCYESNNCKTDGLKQPIVEYERSEGISVTGGYVYNGKSISGLSGKYIFADWTGPLYYLQKEGSKWEKGNIDISNKPSDDLKILSFAEDNAGELYLLTNTESGPERGTGAIYKIVTP